MDFTSLGAKLYETHLEHIFRPIHKLFALGAYHYARERRADAHHIPAG